MKKDFLIEGVGSRKSLLEHLEKVSYANLFLINVDNFSNFNIVYGFEKGDEILLQIAKLLIISKPQSAKIFSVNSDEFAIVCSQMLDVKRLSEIASSMISFFDQMDIYIDDSLSVKASISIGIAIGSGTNILHQAREALKELREHSRGAYKIYNANSSYIKKQQQNNYWIDRIKNAFEHEMLLPYYQPIQNNKTKKIEKYECLARICEGGVAVPPIRFLEASKLTGTLSLVTKVMIERSFKAFADNNLEFSINITNTDLYLNYLEEFLLKHAQKNNINPSRVVLEILEDIDSLSSDEILNQLNSLRKYGFKIAIDDFGSMSSNLSRLLEFSPDYVKIDGSFIKNILEDKKSLIIVESIVFLCKRSNIKVIAEFVHNKEVQAKIEELGIEYSQGYYIGEPQEKY